MWMKLELRKLELRKNEEAKGRKDPVIPMKLGDNGTMVQGIPCVTPCYRVRVRVSRIP